MGSLSAVDLFCGIGGTTTGLIQAGFSVIGAVDCMKGAVAGYRLNHPDVKVWGRDIRRIPRKTILCELNINPGDLDLLAGCPPCQGFSKIRTKTFRDLSGDERNDLVFQYVRFVKILRPKTLLLENVPGLMGNERMERIKRKLISLGYDLDYQVLDAADYGVPQRRRRFILVGSRIGEVSLAAPQKQRKTVRDAIAFLQGSNGGGDKWHRIRTKYTDRVMAVIRMIEKDGGLRSDLPEKYQLECHKKSGSFKDVYGRMKWDEVAPTLTGGCTSISKGRFIHPEEDRGITLREAAILQGFPKRYKLPDGVGLATLAVLIGNAFPPAFTAAQARVLRDKILAAGAVSPA